MINKTEQVKVKINYFFNIPQNIDDKKKIIDFLLENINKKCNNYAGFTKKSELKNILTEEIFGFESQINFNYDYKYKINQKKITEIIKTVLNKCYQMVNKRKPINFYLFPTFNSFIKNRMSGVSGFTSDKNNILLFIVSKNGWQSALKDTVVHELAHSFSYSYHQWRTLLDSLIFEGLAENFREKSIGGKSALWSIVLSHKQSLDIFRSIKDKLNSSSDDDYQKIFFGKNDEYPFWSGYATGYQIVKSFLSFTKKTWLEIFKTKPKIILKESMFGL